MPLQQEYYNSSINLYRPTKTEFPHQLSLKNGTFINNYYRKLNKILLLIDNMKKYHLDKKNFIFSIGKIIKNER